MELLAPLNHVIMRLNELGIAGILYQAWIVVVYLVVAAFCLMTLFLFASTDVTKVMTLLSHSGRVLIGS